MALRIGSALFAAMAALLASSSLPVLAQGQIEILDATYTATSANTSDSHYRLPPDDGTPSNWRSPNDYASGRAHVRLEVIEKPSAAQTLYNVCFEATPTYACLPYSPEYTATGVYDYEYPFSAFYQGDQVDWAQGTEQIALILKDHNEQKKQGDPNYYPTTIHVTISLLTSGTTYVPPSDEPDPVSDAGDIDDPLDASDVDDPLDASDAIPDAATPTTQPDAATPVAMPMAGGGGTASGGASGASGVGGNGGSGGIAGMAPPLAGSISDPRRSTKDDDVTCAVLRVHAQRTSPASLGLLVLSASAVLGARARRRRCRLLKPVARRRQCAAAATVRG